MSAWHSGEAQYRAELERGGHAEDSEYRWPIQIVTDSGAKQPYPEEFKIEAVKQITERGYRVADVSARIGVSQHSLYKWIKAYSAPKAEQQAQVSQTEELRRLKAELRRVTEERDILKKAAAYFAKQSG